MFSDPKNLKDTLELFDGLIDVALHDVESDEQYWEVVSRFFENRDDTVRDAGLLAHALIIVLSSVGVTTKDRVCGYFHDVRDTYELLLRQCN